MRQTLTARRWPLAGARVNIAIVRFPTYIALIGALALGCDASQNDSESESDSQSKKKKKRKKKKKKKAAKKADKSPAGGTTVFVDPDTGKTRVKGGKEPTGDPKDCAAYKACCTSPKAGLFCGLSTANSGDCAKKLKSVRQFLSESGASRPPGC